MAKYRITSLPKTISLSKAQYEGLHKFVDGGENDKDKKKRKWFREGKRKGMYVSQDDPNLKRYDYLEGLNMTAEEFSEKYPNYSSSALYLPEVTVTQTSSLSEEGKKLYDQAYKSVQNFNSKVAGYPNYSNNPNDWTGPNSQERADLLGAAITESTFKNVIEPRIRTIDKAIQNATVVMDNGYGSSNKKLYTPKYLKKVEAEYEKWLKAPEGDNRQVGNPAYWAPGQLKSAFSVDTYGNGTWTPGYGPRRQPPSAANNYNDGPLQGFHPEVVFMAPAGSLAAIPELIANFGKSLVGEALTTALPLGEAVTAATAGTLTPLNLIASHYAADAVVNQFPGAISDAGEGKYYDAADKALWGTLGVAGLGIGKGMVSGAKDLGKFLNTESKVLSSVDDVAISLESQIAKLKEQEVLAEESRKVLFADYKAGNITAEEYTAGAKKLNPGLEGTNPRFELEKQLREYKVKQDIINVPQQNILKSEEQLGKNISDGGTNTRGVFEVGDDHVARLSAWGYDDASLLVKYTDKIKSPRIAKTLQVKELNGKVYQVQEKVAGTPIASLTETELQNIPKEHIDNFWKDKAELDNLGLSIDISGGKSNILYDPKKGFQFIDLGIGESSTNEVIAQTYKGLKLPSSPNASAVAEPFEIAAKRIANLSRNNTNRIIKTNKTASTEPAYVQQEFAFPAETVTPSAKLANEQRIIEGMEQARLTGEQTSLVSEQANALKASAEIPKTYPIGNPDYFTHLLSMTKMSAADRKFYTSVVDTVKAQGNMASDFQKNMLERIRSGNFNFSGSKGNINAGVSPELIANTAGSKNVVGGRLANFMTDWGLPLGSMLNPALDVGSPIGTIGSKFFSKSSPLNLLLKGKKAEGATMSIGDILSAGVKNGKVSVPKSFFKKTKDLIKKSDDAVLTVKNNKTNADIYRVKFDPAVEGSNFKVSDIAEKKGIFGRKKNADFKVTSKEDVPLTEVNLEDPGITVYRRIPFSNRYAVIDKAKLIEGKAQWATTGASAQKFAEGYGKGLIITGATGALIWAAEPSEEEKKEVQDKWVKDQQTKAYDDAVKQHEIQVEVEKKAKYEKHKAYITTLITNAVEKGNSQEKVIADLHTNGISAEDLIQIYIDNGVPKEEAEEYINTIIRNDIFIKKKGGEILDLTENEINEYKKGGWIVERIN